MKKFIKYFVIFIIVALVVIQFFRPDKTVATSMTADDINKKMQIPANIQGIFKRSCYDCHSNETKWPWYSAVAPVSWVIADDITKGRAKMNFSEWGKMKESKQEQRLSDICEQIKEDKMPLPKYLLLHKDNTLSKAEKDTIYGWVKSLGIDFDLENNKKK